MALITYDKKCSVVTYGKFFDKVEHYFLDEEDTAFFSQNMINSFAMEIPTAGGYDSREIEVDFLKMKYISQQSYDECLFISDDGHEFFEKLEMMREFTRQCELVSINKPLYKFVNKMYKNIEQYNSKFKQGDEYLTGLKCRLTEDDAIEDTNGAFNNDKYANIIEFIIKKDIKFVKFKSGDDLDLSEKNEIFLRKKYVDYYGLIYDDHVVIHHDKLKYIIDDETITKIYN